MEIKSDNWLSNSDDEIQAVIRQMENAEGWVATEGALINAIKSWEEALMVSTPDDFIEPDIQVLALIVAAMAYVPTGQALHFIAMLSRINWDTLLIQVAARTADASKESKVMLDRIYSLSRLSLLRRIFGEDRRKLMFEILNMMELNNAGH